MKKANVMRFLSVMFASVFCAGILAGCSVNVTPSEPEVSEEEDESYEEEEYVEEDYEEEDIEEEAEEEEPEAESEEAASAVGIWYTEDYDENENWAGSYAIELKEDKTATCEGYRNRDAGTWESKGSDKVLITFDSCETDEPGEGWTAAEDYSYTIEMTIDGDDAEIKIDAPYVISNLEDGTLHRGQDKGTVTKGMSDKVSKSKAKGGKTIEFKTTDMEGNKISSDKLFAEHEFTVVNVWATWCGPCVGELPELNKLNKKLAKKDCAVVGLVGDGEDDYAIADAADIIEECGVEYTNLLPWKGAIDKDFVIDEGWPTTFFVDREGNLVGEPVVGADPDAYEETIDELLSGK